jgi:hypothetical protein
VTTLTATISPDCRQRRHGDLSRSTSGSARPALWCSTKEDFGESACPDSTLPCCWPRRRFRPVRPARDPRCLPTARRGHRPGWATRSPCSGDADRFWRSVPFHLPLPRT